MGRKMTVTPIIQAGVYAAATDACQQWINNNAGFYASMIPSADVEAIAKVVTSAAITAFLNQSQGNKS